MTNPDWPLDRTHATGTHSIGVAVSGGKPTRNAILVA
jgi:hypothetical protein